MEFNESIAGRSTIRKLEIDERSVDEITVVIPLFNKEKYIHRCVNSVLSQTVSDFSLIVVDDGSTDGSVQSLRDICDDRLSIFYQNNAGVSSARNKGIELANPGWIVFLDADDYWLPYHLEELKKIIKIAPSAGLISTNYVEANSSTDISIRKKRASRISLIDYFPKAAKKAGIVWSSAAAIRRDVALKMGGFRQEYKTGEDLEFWARVALDYPVAYSDEVTAVYFRGIGGVSEQRQREISPLNSGIELNELSPSVNMLLEKLSYGKYKNLENKVFLYINSRVGCSVRTRLILGDIKSAKLLSGLYSRPLITKDKITKVVISLPGWMLRLIIKIIKNGKI